MLICFDVLVESIFSMTHYTLVFITLSKICRKINKNKMLDITFNKFSKTIVINIEF